MYLSVVCEAVRNCKALLVANISGRCKLPRRADNPFKMCSDSELGINVE